MKYLLAVDGSSGSQHAFDYLCDNILSRGEPSEDHLFLLFVVEEVSTLDFQYESMVYASGWINTANEELKERAEGVLLDYSKQCKTRGVNYTALLRTGHPREAIVDECREHSVDMLVCGSRGIGLLKRVLLGSVSSYLATHSPVPILIVHQKTDG